MADLSPRTEFVRRTILDRRYVPDESYVRDLLAIERLTMSPSLGIAGSMALSNLVSRYPREAEAVVRELGVRPFEPLEEARVASLMSERLRLAERRHPLGRLNRDGTSGLFEF